MMNEPMNRYMKVGLIHFMAYPQTMKGEGPIVETVRKIALDDYFSVIELTWIKDSKIRAEVRKMLDTAHMTVAFGGQPMLLSTGMNINDLNEENRQKAVALLKEGIDEAAELGAVGFAFLSGRYEEATREESLAALVKSTCELCDYARQKGSLKIVHEVFDYDIDKKSLIGPATLARRYAETVRKTHDNFGLMVDLSHLPLLRETAEQAIVPIQDYLVHAHMGNCVVRDASLPAYGDAHPRFGFPGSENDVTELTEYLRILLKVGYLNTENPPIVSFEVKPFADEDPDLVIANAKRVLNDAWARL
jgi:sugar phosphate isomerase/epimerase